MSVSQPEFNDRDIHERALALVEAHFDDAADRLVLMHACAMMTAAMAADAADPIEAATAMLRDQAIATLEFTGMSTGHPYRPKVAVTNPCPKCGGDCDPDWGCDQTLN